MLEVGKRRLINTILILGLVFWLTALGTVLLFYHKLKQNQPILFRKTVQKRITSTISVVPTPLPTPTPLPLKPEKVTLDPINGDVINKFLPLTSIDKTNHQLSLLYQGKIYTYIYTAATKFFIIKKNLSTPQDLSYAQAAQLLAPGIKLKLAADKNRVITFLILSPQ